MKRLALAFFIAVLLLTLLPAGETTVWAQSGNQWQVDYFNNPNWAGAPVYTTYTNMVNFNWGSDTSPAPYVPNQYWTATLLTNAYFYGGTTRFDIQADDEFVLVIDGVTYADTRNQGQPGKAQTYYLQLSEGYHSVTVYYKQYVAAAYISVNWAPVKNDAPTPPQPQPQPRPSGQLVTDFGDYAACMQQQIHQKNCFVTSGAWNAPNMGSIANEPQILLWTRCKADEVKNKRLYPNQDKMSARCSKTEAGFFRN